MDKKCHAKHKIMESNFILKKEWYYFKFLNICLVSEISKKQLNSYSQLRWLFWGEI